MTAGLLLAAGTSQRFGAADKLLAPLEGMPLVTHAAEALRAAGFDPLLAVVTSERVADLLDGFSVVRLPPGPAAQSRSLAAGVAEAEARGAERVIVALGDMPRVTPELLRTVAERCAQEGAAAAYDGTRPLPPAAFGRALFGDLRAMSGDKGAAPLLRTLEARALVTPPPGELVDVDTPSDLARLGNSGSPPL